MKGAFEQLFDLILFLQVIKALSIYKVNMPPNLAIYMNEIRVMVDFETLKADNLLKMIDEDLSVEKIMGFV